MEDENALERQIRAINERFEEIERQNQRGKSTVIVLVGSHSTSYGLPGWKAPERVRTCVSRAVAGQPAFARERVDLSGAVRVERLNAMRRSLLERGIIKEAAKGSRAAEAQLSLRRGDQLEALSDLVVGQVVRAPGYAVRFPLSRGGLNASVDGEYSEESAFADLLAVIEHVVLHRMGLDAAELAEHDLLLSLPDRLDRRVCERLLETLMRRLRFRGVSLQQEAVLCFLGRNCALGGLVDLGYTQAALVCVEEGLQHRESRFALGMSIRAVRDVWRAVLRHRRGLDLDPYDFGALEDRLWEACAHFSMNPAHVDPYGADRSPVVAAYRVELESVEDGEPVEIVLHTEDFVLALHFLFESAEFNPLPLHRAVVEWAGGLAEGMRGKVLSSLVLAGGLAGVPGFAYVLEERVKNALKGVEGAPAEVAVVQENHETAINDAAFLGATIVPKLDCFAEVLVLSEQFLNPSKDEEREKGAEAQRQYLREKLTFCW